MIQRLVTLLITLYISISLQAQDKKKPGFTKEEFRARQEAYLTHKAEITQEEATKFFPIYFELQDRKKTVNDKAWEQARKGKNPKTTDAEYEQIIEGIVKARIEADKLDLEYLQRFKKILSPKKIYKLQRAEIKFHRDILKIMHQSPKKIKATRDISNFSPNLSINLDLGIFVFKKFSETTKCLRCFFYKNKLIFLLIKFLLH